MRQIIPTAMHTATECSWVPPVSTSAKHVYFSSPKSTTAGYLFSLKDTNSASHTSVVQAGLSGSCSVAAVGSGSAAAKTAAAVVADEHSWSPSAARFSHLSDQVEYIDDTSIFSPSA